MQTISQSELQEDLQRFQGRFSSWLADALEPLTTDPNPAIRRGAMDLQVRFVSAALDIALGPDTDANLLDMVTFVEMARATTAAHWVPEVFQGKQGAALGEALRKAGEEVWEVARRVLSDPDETQLRQIIERWRAENPQQLHVAGMRLPNFANPGGAGFATTSAEARGLFAGVRKAVQAADQARLLGERAVFAAQRLPFLIRMQARLASQQLLADAHTDLAPALAGARRAVRGALMVAGLLGLGLLVRASLARRKRQSALRRYGLLARRRA
jgi:hypothetical protein